MFYRPSNSLFNPAICSYKRKFFWSILFLNKSQQRGIPQRLLDKCSHLFIYNLLKFIKIAIDKNCLNRINLGIRTYGHCWSVSFEQVFVFRRLINKNVLEWFLLIICKRQCRTASINLSRKHPKLYFWLRREGQQMPNTDYANTEKLLYQTNKNSYWRLFLKIFQHPQENTWVGVSFSYSCRPSGLQLY